jgi:ubiquinone/menaquinone biosynthesis C-methylase UbiE
MTVVPHGRALVGVRSATWSLGVVPHGASSQTVGMAPESEGDRRKRLSQRALFDDVAELYDATRRSYPNEIVEEIVRTAELEPGLSVLEIGCGTGQLTRRLAGRGLDITAIDIGPAMIAGSQRNVNDPKVAFQVSSFEDFQASQAFDLIVSATAFHWVDPDLGLAKAADILRPSGWLALLSTGERYREPLRSTLRQLWAKYNPGQAKWVPGAPWAEPLRETDLFGTVVEATHEQALELAARTVLGVECTRATYLGFNPIAQQGFAADLEALLQPAPTVSLVQETYLAMAPVSLRGF